MAASEGKVARAVAVAGAVKPVQHLLRGFGANVFPDQQLLEARRERARALLGGPAIPKVRYITEIPTRFRK